MTGVKYILAQVLSGSLLTKVNLILTFLNDILRLPVLTGDENNDAGKHREGCEEGEKNTEGVPPALHQNSLVFCSAHNHSSQALTFRTVASTSMEHEEVGGLDSTVGYKAQDNEYERNKEAVETKVLWCYFQRNDTDVDQGRENSSQSLSSHHSTHVVRWKLSSNTNQTALEDGSADVEEDNNDKGGAKEPLLPLIRVNPGHDQNSNKQGGHERECTDQPEIQFESLTIEHIEDNKRSIRNI